MCKGRILGWAALFQLLASGAWAGGLEFPRTDPRLSMPPVMVVAQAEGMSLDDLGFTKEESQGDPKLQRDLDARSDMLAIHQTLGLITAVPMVTNYVLGLVGEPEEDLLLHGGLGLATAGLYLTTASFAIFAPKIEGMKSTGNSDLHQLLAIVHGACMIATPILGELAEHDDDHGELHFAAATGLVASYLTAMALMTF